MPPWVLLVVAPVAHAGHNAARAGGPAQYPSVNHPTPWLALAQVLAKAKVVHGSSLHRAATGLAVTSTGRRPGSPPPPPVAMSALVLAAGSTRLRFAGASASAAACTYLGYWYAAAWTYYVPVTLTLLATVGAAALPRAMRARPDHPSGHHPEAAITRAPEPVLSLR